MHKICGYKSRKPKTAKSILSGRKAQALAFVLLAFESGRKVARDVVKLTKWPTMRMRNNLDSGDNDNDNEMMRDQEPSANKVS